MTTLAIYLPAQPAHRVEHHVLEPVIPEIYKAGTNWGTGPDPLPDHITLYAHVYEKNRCGHLTWIQTTEKDPKVLAQKGMVDCPKCNTIQPNGLGFTPEPPPYDLALKKVCDFIADQTRTTATIQEPGGPFHFINAHWRPYTFPRSMVESILRPRAPLVIEMLQLGGQPDPITLHYEVRSEPFMVVVNALFREFGP